MSISKSDLHAALKKFFGFNKFMGLQEGVVQSILAGTNTFVIMPTGGGKSLCYQLPSFLLPGTSVIVSPLIALMKNQVDAIRGFGENDSIAHFLNSSLTKTQTERVKRDVSEGRTKMLYVAPETLKKDLGAMSIFPSNTLHEVKPVTSGVRYCLVGWCNGPRLK